MTNTSYAQNFEDVMLWRALKNIESGFYIDIGAWSPELHSVTRLFYDHGWRGINVEPNPAFCDQLKKCRSRDVNLQIAVSDYEGSVEMNFLSGSGLNTLCDITAERHVQAGLSLMKQKVHVTTLAKLWSQYVLAGQCVHFLKVDVERLEEAVLRSNDWKNNRPWIVVVEATLPMSPIECYADWEPILIAADYVFAYADGLNRFYVANEHPELLKSFKFPPNVFDNFILHDTQVAESRAIQAEIKVQQLERELDSVYQSYYWKITFPLRWTKLRFHFLYKLIIRTARLNAKWFRSHFK